VLLAEDKVARETRVPKERTLVFSGRDSVAAAKAVGRVAQF
jgi:hypothetical protein